MKYLIDSALRDLNWEWISPPSTCITGNCAWEDYYTLAICETCTDLTKELIKNCEPDPERDEGLPQPGCDISLPNGFSLGGSSKSRRNVVMVNTTDSPLGGDYSNPIAIVQSIMAFDPKHDASKNVSSPIPVYSVTADSIFSARECALQACVQKQFYDIFKASEFDNEEKDKDAEYYLTIDDEIWDTSTIEDDGTVYVDFDMSDMDLPESLKKAYANQEFFIANASFEAMKSYVKATINGYVSTKSGNSTEFSYIGGESATGDAKETKAASNSIRRIFENTVKRTWTGFICDETKPRYNDMECAMTNLAAAITTGMKVAAWESVEDPRYLTGTTLRPIQKCTAHWQYISAPIAVWLLSLALLIGTIWKTRRARIKAWRTSPLAILLLSLDSEDLAHLRDWQNYGDDGLRDLATKLRLRLKIDERGPRFVRAESPERDAAEKV